MEGNFCEDSTFIPDLSGFSIVTNAQNEDALMTSQYAKVVFLDIPDFYSTDTDLTCKFQVNSDLKVEEDDYIGIFNVGWMESKEAIAKHNVAAIEGPDNSGQVTFELGTLPSNSREFFQFCYIKQRDIVCGASVPFQFKIANGITANSSNNSDCIEVLSDGEISDNEMVFVHSRPKLSREILEKAFEENKVLKKDNHSLERQVKLYAEKIKSMMDSDELRKKEMGVMKDMIVDFNNKIKMNEELNKKGLIMKETLDKALVDIDVLKSEKFMLQVELGKAMEEIKNLRTKSISQELNDGFKNSKHDIHTQVLKAEIATLKSENEKINKEKSALIDEYELDLKIARSAFREKTINSLSLSLKYYKDRVAELEEELSELKIDQVNAGFRRKRTKADDEIADLKKRLNEAENRRLNGVEDLRRRLYEAGEHYRKLYIEMKTKESENKKLIKKINSCNCYLEKIRQHVNRPEAAFDYDGFKCVRCLQEFGPGDTRNFKFHMEAHKTADKLKLLF